MRPRPSMACGRLLCPAQCPGALHILVANDVIGIHAIDHSNDCYVTTQSVASATPQYALVQPYGIKTYHIIVAKVVRRIRALHVGVPAIVDPLPGDREYGWILFHEVFSLVNEGGAPGKVEFTINLRDQGIEGRILPFGIALGFLLFSELGFYHLSRFR